MFKPPDGRGSYLTRAVAVHKLHLSTKMHKD
jgi:hypothetical protein